MAAGHYLFGAPCLAARACFFFWSALLTWACFCEDFFWLDFGDLSPMIFIFFCWVDSPAACKFLRREGDSLSRMGGCK